MPPLFPDSHSKYWRVTTPLSTVSSPVGWVQLVGGGADLQGGPIFFTNAEKQENKREQGGAAL